MKRYTGVSPAKNVLGKIEFHSQKLLENMIYSRYAVVQ
jgi:hypothetical protein